MAIIAIAAAIGFAVGAGVGLIGGAVAWLHYIFFGVPLDGHLSAGMTIPAINALAAPVIGGVLVGLTVVVIHYLRPREIVDPIEANALYGGRMSLRDSLDLALITVISVGFGGSAGLEAAYTQAGSGLASKVGRGFRLRRQDLRLLVGCGSAAAISAAFNSPLAGAFYAFELVIGSYTLQSLAPVASAALCGNLAIHAIAGAEPLFEMPHIVALGGHDYPLFLLLGLGAALISIVTMRAVTVVENSLRHRKAAPLAEAHAWRCGRWNRCLLLSATVLGSGHGEITFILSGGFSMQPLMLLLIAKIAASAFTVGSGMRGGLFSSSLLLGALFGAAVAAGLQAVAPGLAVSPVAYALAGMGAVAAGIVGAPVTMTLLVLETTGNFSLTIGVMIAVIACTVVVRQSFGYSFATWRFHVRGLPIRGAYDVGWIADLTVAKLMRRDLHLVPASETVPQLREHFPAGRTQIRFRVRRRRSLSWHDRDRGGAFSRLRWNGGKYRGSGSHPRRAARADAGREHPCGACHVYEDGLRGSSRRETAQNGRVLGFVSEAYLLRRYSQELEKHRIEEANGGVFSPEGRGI